MIDLIVHGTPAPQGSKRHVGNGRMVESSKKVTPWRDAVRTEASGLIQRWVVDRHLGDRERWIPLDEPLVVDMVFTLAKPVSAPKTRRTEPMRTPDLSKLCRATEDALTDAGIWRDDARVVEYRRLAKVYPREDRDALDVPGVLIRIRTREEALS